ncbi:MAG TPA: tetratricopeptide repeat protein [Pyrinomonadaceae bacterium]
MRNRTLNSLSIILTAFVILYGPASGGHASRASAAASSFQQKGSVEDAAALVTEGVSALEKGDETAAALLFQRAIKIDPGNEMAHTYLGIIADRAGNPAEAERHFAAAAIGAPTSPAARNNHGAILLRLGRTEQAAKQFEISLKLDPMQAGALANLAQIRFAAGTPEGLRAARDLFERARAIEPDVEFARALVVIALRMGDRASASRYYGDYKALIPGANSRVTGPSGRAELGTVLYENGLVNEAAEELDAVVAAEPANVKAIVLLAQTYLARKDIVSAGRTLESAVARGLDEAPLYAALADIYQASGHIENAIPAMRLAIERDPKNEAYRFRYGMLLVDTKAPAAAVIRLREALAEFPNSSKLWFALGVALFTNRKHDEAATAFERVVALSPKFAPALAYLGMIYDETGRYAEAVALYERAAAADERLAVAQYLLADAMMRQTSPDLARAELRLKRALELDETFSPARLTLAKLYVRAERLTEAVTQLERLVAANPNLAEAQYQLGRLYMRLKRTAEAQKALATFKRLNENQQQQAENDQQELVRRLANVRF